MRKTKHKARKTTKRKQVVNSKKYTYDGIDFASGLELKMYQLLKQAGIKNQYEGKTYQIFEPFELDIECYERATRRSKQMNSRPKVSQIRYTPDFIGENEEWIIECKGRANESFPIRWKLFKKMISTWEKPPIVFKPTNTQDCEQVIEILKQKGYATK